jgi:hypothetical protein
MIEDFSPWWTDPPLWMLLVCPLQLSAKQRRHPWFERPSSLRTGTGGMLAPRQPFFYIHDAVDNTAHIEPVTPGLVSWSNRIW